MQTSSQDTRTIANMASIYSFDNVSLSSQNSSMFSSELGEQALSDGFVSATASSDLRASPIDISGGFDDDTSPLPCYEDAEELFLEEHEDYFEHLHVDNVRKEQYPNIDLQRLVYLDYASFGLYSRYQVEQHMRLLLDEGPNVCSVSLSSAHSSSLISYLYHAQKRLLQLFNVTNSDYGVVFTAGFTAAYRLFSEIYPFSKGTHVLTLLDNHEAIKHIVATTERYGSKCTVVPLKKMDLTISSSELRLLLRKKGSHGVDAGLFVYPAQSCLSGIKHSLNWITEAQENGFHVLLDISTHFLADSLDLSLYQPQFVLGSPHLMLGYPSGMGFLLVRKRDFSMQKDMHSLTLKDPSSEGNDCHIVCEDDSLNLLSFAALTFGLQHLESVGITSIQKRLSSLTKWLFPTLRLLRHKNAGRPLLQIYGSSSTKSRGNIISFDVLDSTGNVLPASLIQRLAHRSNIIIGAGYFSNPGLATMLSGHDCETRVLDCSIFKNAVNFSTLRISVGPMTTFSDVYRLVQFLCRFRDEDYLPYEAADFMNDSSF
ncbi:hypothetical protein KP509_21G072100 [Ceratopteris richardii]|uniref:Aminotransferase class V domain-containing protein n=1 Tax=Ceratopteris richardii TaxID=49495 RepID=A0A8T2SCT0_CERRI|nr:hypothetical protein KP509_21G072100 [Ceratopteris richardii]